MPGVTMRNAHYKTNHVRRVCENKLGIAFRKGAHFSGWFELDGSKAARITVPMGRKPIPPKTYKTMADQLKLSVEEFDDLLACPLHRREYVRILRGQT